MELKKPTTYEEQIELLKQKNIVISDEETAKTFLSTVNYYRFSGYYLPFLDSHTGQCFRPTTFERLKGMYDFDSDMRNLILQIIERIEIYIKAQVSHYSAHTYGAEGYCDVSTYNSKHDHQKFQERIEQCKSENRKTLVYKHHTQKYNGHFPIWVIIDFFSIGMLSYFYTGMKNIDKAAIAHNLYGVNYQTLTSWLRCITDLRNRCAHYSRLYYWKFPAEPRMPKNEYLPMKQRLFSQVYMLKLMYPDQDEWNQTILPRIRELMDKHEEYTILKHIGFPGDWESRLIK